MRLSESSPLVCFAPHPLIVYVHLDYRTLYHNYYSANEQLRNSITPRIYHEHLVPSWSYLCSFAAKRTSCRLK